MAFCGKFMVWPGVVLLFCLFDQHVLHLLDLQVYRCLLLVAVTPIAANTVVIATLLETYPKEAATTTLLSTLFALVYIPLVVTWMP